MNRRDGPTVVVDWDRFYSMRDEELDQKIGNRKLLSNQEAVQTGLLMCKYLVFDAFFEGMKFFVSLRRRGGNPIVFITVISSPTRAGRRVGGVQPCARPWSHSARQSLVVHIENVV